MLTSEIPSKLAILTSMDTLRVPANVKFKKLVSGFIFYVLDSAKKLPPNFGLNLIS